METLSKTFEGENKEIQNLLTKILRKTWEILSRIFKQTGKTFMKIWEFLVICLKEHGKYIIKVEEK